MRLECPSESVGHMALRRKVATFFLSLALILLGSKALQLSIGNHSDNGKVLRDARFRVVKSGKCVDEGVLLSLQGTPWLFAKEDFITQAVQSTGSFEPDIFLMIQRQLNISLEGILVDIGANVGAMTSAALSMGRKVVAIEALPDNANLLWCSADNLDRTHLLNLYNVPLADPSKAPVSFCVCRPPGNPTDGVLVPKAKFAEVCSGLLKTDQRCDDELQAATLDDLRIADPIAVMKIDVEGNECRILKGSAATIRDSKPCVVLSEFNPGLQIHSGCSIFEMADFMASIGYLPYNFPGESSGECSSTEITRDLMADMNVPGHLYNICWKPRLNPSHRSTR